MSDETVPFLLRLAEAKARSTPSYLRASAKCAFLRRWSRMLAVSAASTLTASLLSEKTELELDGLLDGEEPWLQDVLSEARHDLPVGPSRVR